ncbi:MAG: transposase [Oscillospiraceae bacterium]|nr:transposase [Oscillospiraceae bacterium]
MEHTESLCISTVTDGMKSYGSGDYVHAGCWAHARRDSKRR